MIYTLGTVTAAGSAPFYTNPALFKTAASYNASTHRGHRHPHNVTTTTVTVTVPYVVATGYDRPGDFAEGETTTVENVRTTVTVTVPYVVATGYDQQGDFTEGEHTTLKDARLSSSTSFTEEVQQRASPVNNTQVNSSGLKKAILSGLSISIVVILALLVVFLLFYFQKLRCGRRSRGDPEAPLGKPGFEGTPSQKRWLSCGPSNGAVEPVVPRPSAPTTTEGPRSTQEAPLATQASSAASTPTPPSTPLAITQLSTPVARSIFPPSSLPNVYPVKAIRNTLAEELGRPLSPVSPVSPKTVTWAINRALTWEHSEIEDDDLDLPELRFGSVPRCPVPSPVFPPQPSSSTAEIWESEGPSEEGRQAVLRDHVAVEEEG